MYYTYVLKSQLNGYVYVGSTANVAARLEQHNGGASQSTKAYRPWKLMEFRECSTRSEAMRLEKFLKTGQQKEILKNKYSAQ